MSWINKILPAGISRADGGRRASVPEGVWTKCIKCEAVLYKPDLERNANVCPKCEHHMRVSARKRIDLFLDKDGREEVFTDIEPIDRLRFRDKKKYVARLAAAQKSTGERDALVAMRGTLHDMPIVVVAFEFGFHGGSMGQAVGEKFSRAAQLALKERIPMVCFAASGGARMQEALISLMQMAKTSAVIERMHSESVPYISVLTDPIYGGVSASLALLGDLNIAEPEARAGFAGPNIIEQTIRQKLPKGFQRSEFLLEHGAIDMIVSRPDLRDTIARLLAKMLKQEMIPDAIGEEPVIDDVTAAATTAEALAEVEAREAREAEEGEDAGADNDEAGDASEKADKSGKSGKSGKSDKAEKAEKSEKAEKDGKSEKADADSADADSADARDAGAAEASAEAEHAAADSDATDEARQAQADDADHPADGDGSEIVSDASDADSDPSTTDPESSDRK